MAGAPIQVDPSETDDLAINTFAARVSRIVGEPTEAQLDLIRAQYVDDSLLTDEEVPFVFSAEVTNNQLDSYFTRMHETSLRNYVEDAIHGISFMDSHRTGGMLSDAEQAYGRSFDAKFVGAGGRGNQKQRVDEWFYIPRNSQPNGQARPGTEDLIRSIRTGTGRDISISFFGGEWRCSICDRDMMRDWGCMHLPGFAYKPVDQDGKTRDTDERVTAAAWIHNAHQTEASSVYDGATPGAMVKKAGRMVAEGMLKPRTVELIEQRYRIHLPHTTTGVVPDLSTALQEETTMPPEGNGETTEQRTPPQNTQTPPTPDGMAGIRQALAARGVTDDSNVADMETTIRTLVDEHRAQGERLQQLEAPETQRLIEEGRAYRTNTVADALTEGVRAMGEAFPTETYQALLASASIDHVRQLRDDWKKAADAAIPAGRTTTERPESREPAVAGRQTPDKAYSTR